MKLLITFTYGVSLQDWYNNGLLSREVSLYKRLSEKGVRINFLTFGDKKDLIHANSGMQRGRSIGSTPFLSALFFRTLALVRSPQTSP